MSEKKSGKSKRGKLVLGDCFAIPLTQDGYGYCQVQGGNNRETLFAIFEKKSSQILEWEPFCSLSSTILSFAFINNAVPKAEWVFLGNHEKLTADKEIPPFFFGSSLSGWNVQYPDGREEFIRAADMDFEAMIANGFSHEVFWLGRSIVKHIETGEPLRWKGSV